MKDVLRQLLNAEESGRQAVRAKEMEGEQIVRRAHDEAERITREWHERTQREIAELEQAARKDLASRQAALTQHTNMKIEQLNQEARQHWTTAVDAIVTLLLGESSPSQGTSPGSELFGSDSVGHSERSEGSDSGIDSSLHSE